LAPSHQTPLGKEPPCLFNVSTRQWHTFIFGNLLSRNVGECPKSTSVDIPFWFLFEGITFYREFADYFLIGPILDAVADVSVDMEHGPYPRRVGLANIEVMTAALKPTPIWTIETGRKGLLHRYRFHGNASMRCGPAPKGMIPDLLADREKAPDGLRRIPASLFR
jgi:hypothetical protein